MHTVHIDSLPLQAYQAMEMAIFIKNINGRYLWANDFFIRKSAGYRSVSEIYYKQDHEFAWRDYADELISNDKLLFETGKSVSVCERIMRHEGTYLDIVSKKSLLIDHSGACGLIGFSIELPISSIANILSKREYAAAILASEGYTDKEIAKKWDISPRTVESYILNAKQKLNVSSRAELVVQIFQRTRIFTG